MIRKSRLNIKNSINKNTIKYSNTYNNFITSIYNIKIGYNTFHNTNILARTYKGTINNINNNIIIPIRGSIYINKEILKNYIILNNAKNWRYTTKIQNYNIGNIILKGISIKKSGNILTDLRKNKEKLKTGFFKNHYTTILKFPLYNRRAIIGHKIVFSYTIK